MKPSARRADKTLPKYTESAAEPAAPPAPPPPDPPSAMTKFCYSEYLSQFRNAGGKCNNALSRLDIGPVVFAIRRGDVEAVNDLATSAPHSLLKENKDGWIPLHDAAYWGQAECLKALLRGSVDKRTLQEQTALLLAVSGEHLSCVRCLLEAGADTDINSKNKETPLYKACELENVEMVNLILSYGATVNQRCGQGWTALHEAVSRNNTEICEILIRQMGALCYLIGKGTYAQHAPTFHTSELHQIVAELLTKNADANKTTNSGLLPLHILTVNSLPTFAVMFFINTAIFVLRVVSLLVSVTSRARLRHSWVSPLHLAAEHNRHTVAAVLLKTGADVNATLAHNHAIQYADHRATALYFAIANGSTEAAEVLLNAGASVSLDPVSPLLMAVRQGCISTVPLLLERGADVDARIPSFPTTFPGVIALCMNNLPLLKCLLNNGCDALSCFVCAYGNAPHPASGGSRVRTFCEWISSPALCKWAGPIIDLLLEYVGHVQLCTKLTELLDSQEQWLAIKKKSVLPRSLQHLCRLSIRTQMGRRRLNSLTSLPLPDRVIQYLRLTE
uniref:Ankyrin repeat and SOCS box containing 2b n=1 Tax=Echeneis naucrates TaxID=173247 RepID=A0A665WR29_ECHNA